MLHVVRNYDVTMFCNGYSYWVIDFFWSTNKMKEIAFEVEFLDSVVGFVASVYAAIVVECYGTQLWSAVILAVHW